MSSENHEVVSIYPLAPDDLERLLTTAGECVFNWSTKDHWPVGGIMSFAWRDGRVRITAGAHRHRIGAIRRNPQVSTVFTSTGTPLGHTAGQLPASERGPMLSADSLRLPKELKQRGMS